MVWEKTSLTLENRKKIRELPSIMADDDHGIISAELLSQVSLKILLFWP